MKAIDFFCGCGGLTKGLTQAGIDVACGIDIDGTCRETYEYNNVDFHESDIRDLNALDLAKLSGMSPNQEDILFAGCAPCQSFSKQRRSNQKRTDATILREFGRLITAARPEFVLMENVPEIAKVKGYSAFRRFLNTLKTNEYNIAHGVLDAKEFGVPQHRRRLVLIASLHHTATLPQPTHGNDRKPYKTVRQAIRSLPPIDSGECHSRINIHVSSQLSETNLKRIKCTPQNGGNRSSWPKELILECHKQYNGHSDVYARMYWDRPAPTLTGKCNSFSNGRFGHPEQDRAISLREAATLQSFPKKYTFFGSRLKIAQQIGNAVPVKLGEVLGSHILRIANEGRKQ